MLIEEMFMKMETMFEIERLQSVLKEKYPDMIKNGASLKEIWTQGLNDGVVSKEIYSLVEGIYSSIHVWE